MKTLITGATGFIGASLLQLAHRTLVRCRSRLPGEVLGDLNDPQCLSEACEGIERVIHCAGLAEASAISDPQAHWRINFRGTKNLVEMAGQNGVKRFIFLSSVKAMAAPSEDCVDEDWPGEPVTEYGRAKRAAEEAVLEAGAKYGMHVVNLRLAMVYGRGSHGNLSRMARAVRAGWFPPLPETGGRRSLVHVNDVVAAVRLVAEHPAVDGRTYIVADPRPYSGREIYDAMRAALGLPPAHWRIPAGMLRAAAKVNGRAAEIVERLVGSACYSPARIERELGFRAQVDLASGLREMLGDPRT